MPSASTQEKPQGEVPPILQTKLPTYTVGPTVIIALGS